MVPPSLLSRRSAARAAGLAASAALLLPLVSAAPPATAGSESPDKLQQAFADAAERYRVPQSVLLGVSYLQSRWDGHSGAPSVTGGYGPMHLTDARTALKSSGEHHHGGEDARGDDSRPRTVRGSSAAVPPPDGTTADRAAASSGKELQTLNRAARLTGRSGADLRSDPAANVAGGAALLAQLQRESGRELSDRPADWYGAVARYSGAEDAGTARNFADDVYAVIRQGMARTTDAGQRVALAADAAANPNAAQLDTLGLRKADPGESECPPNLACEWIPAPYEEYKGDDGEDDYGNHDKADRPNDQPIRYIVIHDTEAKYDGTVNMVQDPTYVSWQYTLRSRDGHVAQHVKHKDVAWQAGNWHVNSQSIGLEHEGFLVNPDAWYTEAMYRNSARLVRWMAAKYDIPLDRQHILGHDTVPAINAAKIPGMHTDPGPYWDWQHYFTLLGRPFVPNAGPNGGMVTIRPDYDTHQPEYTSCEKAGAHDCPPHGSGAVRLHTEPSDDAPLVKDVGLHPPEGKSSIGVNDTGARASTGQQYAVAERRGDWTAVWYLGQKAWFKNPAGEPTAVNAKGKVITPKDGVKVEIYGRVLPEKEAYPKEVEPIELTPLPYEMPAGQRYVLGDRVRSEHYYAENYQDPDSQVVRGKTVYYEIQFGHRVAYVKADQVDVRDSRS
ncbi:N-acetylmuramoyl-L-alanine amidase [Streptomyces sp. A7024]|uniref:N-acetylmuramoyl-L-alanine amidase n=1 Tax=Streptomyces coryli TaxID=1128680 RepID=A0A6G4TSP8_9ACTN|nr:N-acetylmuramoyl-L-alanine amidase [Streptomyces coryli]